MSDILDLDALMPKAVTIKFGGEEIAIAPPSTADILQLGYLGQKLQGSEALLQEGKLDTVLSELTDQVYKCIPQLNGKGLSTAQLFKLVEIISEMAIPPDVKDLNARGITVGDPKAL